MPTFRADSLAAFGRAAFEAAGVPPDEARIVAGSLVDANLCGHDSHGVIRLPQYVGLLRDGKLKAGVPLEILNETPAVVAADAHWGLGQVQAYRLLDVLEPKAKAVGVAAGTLRRCGHVGRLGEYAEWAAARGLALFAAVNSHGSGQRVAPPGGLAGRISTNPLCLGTPTAGDPLVLDIGTSACAEGKVRVQYQKKEPVPEGWVQDAAGRPTTNPAVLYEEPRGSILPLGGPHAYKGFGLGLLLDALAGGLSGGACSRADAPLPGRGNSVVVVLFAPALFGGDDHFVGEVTRLAGYVRTTPRAEGVSQITLPGDPERQTKAKRLIEGIAVPDGTWALLAKTAADLGVAAPADFAAAGNP